VPGTHTAKLAALRNTGFDDEATNQRLLNLHRGNVEEVVTVLLNYPALK
jgi:hypothetical protein